MEIKKLFTFSFPSNKILQIPYFNVPNPYLKMLNPYPFFQLILSLFKSLNLYLKGIVLVLCGGLVLWGLYALFFSPSDTTLESKELLAINSGAHSPVLANKIFINFKDYQQKPIELPGYHLVVTDLGLNQELTQNLIETLPSDISLGFSIYANNLESQLRYAREAGFETFIQVPLDSYHQDIKQSLGPLIISPQTPHMKNSLELFLSKCDLLFSKDLLSGFLFLQTTLWGEDPQDLTQLIERLAIVKKTIIFSDSIYRDRYTQIFQKMKIPHMDLKLFFINPLQNVNFEPLVQTSIDLFPLVETFAIALHASHFAFPQKIMDWQYDLFIRGSEALNANDYLSLRS